MIDLPVEVDQQPDDESCGITCLQALYRYHHHHVGLDQLRGEVHHWQTGGTITVNLARNAIDHGFSATIYSYNIQIFDPTWRSLPVDELIDKLKLRHRRIRSKKQKKVIAFYLDFLRKGGKVRFDDLDEPLYDRLFADRTPMIVGLSATYLYQSIRETPDCDDDDIVGNPVGHFVVVAGWDSATRTVLIQDPLQRNPISASGTYTLPFTRFSNAVMLGALTYDENMLVLSRP
jgi:Peptidase C39 family